MTCEHRNMQKCNHSNSRLLYVINDYSIIECGICGFRKTQPIPAPEEIEEIYNKKFYFGDKSRRFGTISELLVKFFRFLRAFEIFILYKPRRILDVGCGRGLMLYYLKRYFKASDLIGTQFYDPAIKYAKEKLGLEVKKGELGDIFHGIEKDFDIICFWHVLEHIDDVDLYISLSYQLLKKDGKLLIEVPNSESFSKKLTGSSWMGWDVPNHLTHFTPDSLTKLLSKHGFTIIKKRYFSIEYSTFFTVQSVMNKIFGKQNVFFNLFRIGNVKPRCSLEAVVHILLAIILAPFSLFVNFILYNTEYGEVVHYVARKQ